MSTETLPVSSFYSTNLNPRVKTFSTLSTRIAQALGYPHINIEAHQNLELIWYRVGVDNGAPYSLHAFDSRGILDEVKECNANEYHQNQCARKATAIVHCHLIATIAENH